jgi:hypothetical protein
MQSSRKDFAFLTQHVRNLRGGSQPILAQASDGYEYVVKFANNLQGPNLPFNESAGSELYRACGLPVPEWRPLNVSEGFIDKNPDCWIQTTEGRLRPASGLCFGSRYLGESGKRVFEILPSSNFKYVRNQSDFWLAWLIDICAEHGDNRQALFTEGETGELEASFIDHGHLFGGPKAELKKNFHTSRYLDPRIYSKVSSITLLKFRNIVQALDTDRLWQRIEAIPTEWKQKSALNHFELCLQRLSSPRLVQNILETIIDAIEQRSESWTLGNGRRPCDEILHLGIRGARGQRNFAHNLNYA